VLLIGPNLSNFGGATKAILRGGLNKNSCRKEGGGVAVAWGRVLLSKYMPRGQGGGGKAPVAKHAKSIQGGDPCARKEDGARSPREKGISKKRSVSEKDARPGQEKGSPVKEAFKKKKGRISSRADQQQGGLPGGKKILYNEKKEISGERISIL